VNGSIIFPSYLKSGFLIPQNAFMLLLSAGSSSAVPTTVGIVRGNLPLNKKQNDSHISKGEPSVLPQTYNCSSGEQTIPSPTCLEIPVYSATLLSQRPVQDRDSKRRLPRIMTNDSVSLHRGAFSSRIHKILLFFCSKFIPTSITCSNLEGVRLLRDILQLPLKLSLSLYSLSSKL